MPQSIACTQYRHALIDLMPTILTWPFNKRIEWVELFMT